MQSYALKEEGDGRRRMYVVHTYDNRSLLPGRCDIRLARRGPCRSEKEEDISRNI